MMYIDAKLVVKLPPVRGRLYYFLPILKDGEVILLPASEGEEPRRLSVEPSKKAFIRAFFGLVARVRATLQSLPTEKAESVNPYSWIRGFRIDLKERSIHWEVASFSVIGRSYTISVGPDGARCTCPDFIFRGRVCKHIATLARLVQESMDGLPLEVKDASPKPLRFTLPKGVNWVEYLIAPPFIYQGSYQNHRQPAEGLKVGVEWEIPERIPANFYKARKYLAYLISSFSLLWERDGSVKGGEFKTSSPIDIREAYRLLGQLGKFRENFPGLFRSDLSAGLHLHFNISDLSDEGKEKVKKFLYKVGLLLEEKHPLLLYSLYGREFNRFCQLLRIAGRESRYAWLNLTGSATVEFRLGNAKASGRTYISALRASAFLFRKARESLERPRDPEKVVEAFVKLAPSWQGQA